MMADKTPPAPVEYFEHCRPCKGAGFFPGDDYGSYRTAPIACMYCGGTGKQEVITRVAA